MSHSIARLLVLLGGILAALCTPEASAAGSERGGWPENVASVPLEFVSAPIRLTIAGRPAVLRVIRGSGPARAVAGAAHADWVRQGALVRRDDDGPWRTVSRVERHRIQVLQLRDSAGGGSDGYLVAWQLDDIEPVQPTREAPTLAHRLVPPSGQVLSVVGSGPGSSGRTLVAWLPGTVDEADRAVTSSATALGLTERSESRSVAGSAGDERARFFSGGNEELALTLHRQGGGTALVIHTMETKQ